VSDLLGSTDIVANGTVVSAHDAACPGSDEEGVLCTTVRVRLTSGPDKGETATFDHTEGPGAAALEAGDRIRVSRIADLPPDAHVSTAYAFADFQRSTPLIALALLFAAAVIVLGRIGGLRALVALAITLAALIKFVIPALLAGRSPVAVSIVGSLAVLLVALYLSQRPAWRSPAHSPSGSSRRRSSRASPPRRPPTSRSCRVPST
jgi:uncharacterized membrane protein